VHTSHAVRNPLTSSVSSQIISSVIPGAGIVRTMEWTLLLSVLSLPGVFLGAAIVKYTGRRNLLMMGFSGYIVFGLIVGIAYDKITLVVPAFIVMYAMMQSSGNFVSPNSSIRSVSVPVPRHTTSHHFVPLRTTSSTCVAMWFNG
jgi:hypothetical protein